jgi:hypothetical protein
MISVGLFVSGGGEGDSDGELRESKDVVESGIVADGGKKPRCGRGDNKLGGTCARNTD